MNIGTEVLENSAPGTSSPPVSNRAWWWIDPLSRRESKLRLPIVGGPATFTNAFDWDG